MITTLWILVALLVLTGIAGTILPILPSAPLVLAAMVIAGWIDDFTKVGWGTILTGIVLTAAVQAIDFISTVYGAQKMGASRLAIVGSLVGTVVGFFFFLPGIILGPFVGAFLGELYSRKDLLQAGKVGIGTWLGLVLGTVAKLALTVIMAGLLIFQIII